MAATTTNLLVISETAARTITKWTHGLMLGELGLWQLPAPLAELYHLGFFNGIASQQPQLARAEHAADRLYLYAFNPKERAEIIQQRLDEHFRAEWDLLPSTPARIQEVA